LADDFKTLADAVVESYSKGVLPHPSTRTLNPQPDINPQPCTLKHAPNNPEPETRNPKLETLNPKP